MKVIRIDLQTINLQLSMTVEEAECLRAMMQNANCGQDGLRPETTMEESIRRAIFDGIGRIY